MVILVKKSPRGVRLCKMLNYWGDCFLFGFGVILKCRLECLRFIYKTDASVLKKKTVKIPCFKKNCQNSMLQKELSKFHASKRIVIIPCFKKNCQNTMLQKKLSKFHASKRTVKIPCFKTNCQNTMLQKELSKYHASKRTIKIPCFKKNCQNSMLQKELSNYIKFNNLSLN